MLLASTTVGPGWPSCHKSETRQPQVPMGEAERLETVPLQSAQSMDPAATRELSKEYMAQGPSKRFWKETAGVSDSPACFWKAAWSM